MTEIHEPALLDYVPAAPLRRKRRIRRVVLLCLGVATAVAGFRWGPTTWARTILLYHQRNCLRYTAPPDQVVFESDPARVALLAVDPNYVIAGGCAFRKPPPDWVAIGPTAAVRTTGPVAMIFLHELKTGGVSRLVGIERAVGATASPYFIAGYDVETHSIRPASFRQPQVSEQHFAWPIDVMDGIAPHLDIRIYAGQVDPADGSHFTIRYEHRGTTGTADGYLRADGRIDLKPRG
jgi:hypothetical protein